MYGAWVYCAALAALLFLMIAVHWLSFFRNIRGCFGFVVFLFCFTLGFGVADAFLNLTFLPPDKEKKVYQVLIDEYPEAKNRSVLCHARLEGTVTEEGMQADGASRSLLLYFPPTSADSLRRGDRLWIYASLQLPPKYGNPDEFDYARYLLRTGSSATAYVSAGQWMPRGHDASRSLWQMAEDCREEVMAMYARLGIRGDNLAVLSALTVGEKRELSDGIRETYSVAGAAHVLALSGLHVGILYGILAGVFSFLGRLRTMIFDRNKSFAATLGRSSSCEWGKLCLLPCLWAFAFIAGFSPSVVRAVVMCSLMVAGKVYLANVYRVSGINIVAATAFFMLLYRPLWLFDVGFQLSFTTVAAILLLQPKLYGLLTVRRWWIKKLWALVTVSLAAQAGAAPLVVLYFYRFSTHFLLTNLCISIPVILIVCAALLLLLLFPFPLLQQVAGKAVNLLLDAQHAILGFIERLPCASVDGLWMDVWEVSLFYLLLFLLFRVWRLPTARNFSIALCCLLTLVSYHFLTGILNAPRPHIAFYHVRNAPAVHCVERTGRSWLVTPDSLCELSRLRRSLAPHWNKQRLEPPKILTAECDNRYLFLRNNILYYRGQCVCLLNDSRWQHKRSPSPLRVDYLFITRGYKGSVSDVKGVFRLRTVVLDASLSLYRRRKLEAECARLGVPCYSVAERGALIKWV